MDCPDETQQQTEQEEQDQLRSVVRKERNKVVPCGRPLQVQIGDFLEVRPEARYTGRLNRISKSAYDPQHYIRFLYKVLSREGHNFLLKEWRYYSSTKLLVHPRGHVYHYGCWKVNGWIFKLVPKEEFVRLQLTADKVEDLGD